MVLERYEKTLELNKLYEIRKSSFGSERINPCIFINSGTVNIYGSQSQTEPSDLDNMILPEENTAVTGFQAFSCLSFVPKYIAIVQDTGTTTELIAIGLDIKEIRNIE